MKLPRVMLSAPASGSGKTLITCGILQAFVNRGYKTASFKCGPDYIDPMFHSRVIGTESGNLDTFFTDYKTTRYLFGHIASEAEISVIEGVMGYYDGLGGISERASSADVAAALEAPVVLVVNCRGMSISVLALIKGFLEFERPRRIQGVILNQLPAGLYQDLKDEIESRIPVRVLGYVPKTEELALESRHLGLVLPDEVEKLKEKLNRLASLLEETVDLDALMAMAYEAPELAFETPKLPKLSGTSTVRIGVARDEAFCFTYRDNLHMLEQMGAELVPFSPLSDQNLPEGIQGLILSGGYPELHAARLSENQSMREEIRRAVTGGIPCIAECGGFLYLHRSLEGEDGKTYPMAGVFDAAAYRTGKLSRFGYITLTARQSQLLLPEGGQIRGHEFHYWESESCGASMRAKKPLRKRSWDCVHGSDTLYAGFPHLFFWSNPEAAWNFLKKCGEWIC
ncbi:MAG TPA: cobyrinate a,c-diamide synthase [Candidatus Merdisoma merdipullorum]|nr:cobyrinate a,c-diamide synthase [Candidatus Merdisoma merdipullorum]